MSKIKGKNLKSPKRMLLHSKANFSRKEWFFQVHNPSLEKTAALKKTPNQKEEKSILSKFLKPFQRVQLNDGSESFFQKMQNKWLTKRRTKLEEPIQINLEGKKSDKASSSKKDSNKGIQFKQVGQKIKIKFSEQVINKGEVLEPDEKRLSFS